MRELIIDSEFETLIPPLSDDEREQLETNIIGDGIRDPIVVWNNVIVDGHNRYSIAKEHGIDFNVVEMEFGSKDEAKLWIIQNQFGRRNLPAYQRSALGLKLKPMIQGKVPDVRKEIAEVAGVSANTIQRVDYIQQHANQETLDALEAGEISINKAYTELKPSEPPTFKNIEGDALERRDAILQKLPDRESKIGLPYQCIAIQCIEDIRDGNRDGVIDGVLKLLEEPTPTTMALAKIILKSM